jgi:hypothetical protein
VAVKEEEAALAATGAVTGEVSIFGLVEIRVTGDRRSRQQEITGIAMIHTLGVASILGNALCLLGGIGGDLVAGEEGAGSSRLGLRLEARAVLLACPISLVVVEVMVKEVVDGEDGVEEAEMRTGPCRVLPRRPGINTGFDDLYF